METYGFDRIPRIHGGPGQLKTLGTIAQSLSDTSHPVLLVADPGLAASGMIETAAGYLRASGFGVHVFTSLQSDPTIAQVDAAADIARREKVGIVVALGGGSAMDLGKAVAAIAPAGVSADHYRLAAHPLPRRPLKKICVPTTSGTGSETTRVSVLTTADKAKVWLWGDEIKADDVLLDPELTLSLPPAMTAATGIDALVHAIEASTNRYATQANDLFCHEAIRLVVRHLERAMSHPGDIEARGALQFAAALGGIGIDNCGTAIAHNIGHALASLRPIHHGRAVGLAMVATLGWNCQENTEKFALVAQAMGEKPEAGAVPAAFERLLRAVNIKVSLAGEGYDDITPERLARQMAEPENAAMRKSNGREVTEQDLLAFARTMLAQH